MDKLKKKIIKYFVLCVFGVSVTESALDNFFTNYMSQYIGPYLSDYKSVAVILLILFLLLTFTVYSVYGFIFHKLTSKAINAESNQQISIYKVYFCLFTIVYCTKFVPLNL